MNPVNYLHILTFILVFLYVKLFSYNDMSWSAALQTDTYLVLLNFQSCRVSQPYNMLMLPCTWNKFTLVTFKNVWLTFSPSQAVVDSFPQAGDLRHHPSTAVNIIFFTVKLCTLLNRQAMFFPLEHQPNIKPSSPTAPSTSSSTAL